MARLHGAGGFCFHARRALRQAKSGFMVGISRIGD
jgi:hypothetical protein